jgi:Uma2 family endonuclease
MIAYARSMATSSAVPVEEYLRTTYHPDMEYLEGQLVERHVGEYFHSRLQALLAATLGLRERGQRFRVFIAQRVKVSDRPRYRIPDICVKALPHQVTPILVEADQRGIRQPETQLLATPLVGEIDFASLFAQLDEPAE